MVTHPATARLLVVTLVAMTLSILGIAAPLPHRGAAQDLTPTSPFVGEVPRAGQIGLLMTTREVAPSSLSTALSAAGCRPIVIAVTVEGRWLTFVGGNPPTFVNDDFLVAVPSLAPSTGFVVRCHEAPRPVESGITLAPIERVDVVRTSGTPTGYAAVVTSGLPSGCAAFDSIEAERTGDAFDVTVRNMISVPPGGACTMIYGIVTNTVALPGTFRDGTTYALNVNGERSTFVAGASIPAASPAAPTNVKLTGALPNLDDVVPAGEGETGRVTVTWESTGVATGFRVYLRDCSGMPTGSPIEVAATDRQYGPLQPCRPGGNVGVSAVSASGESTVTWWR